MRLAGLKASSMAITSESKTAALLTRVSQPLSNDISDCHAYADKSSPNHESPPDSIPSRSRKPCNVKRPPGHSDLVQSSQCGIFGAAIYPGHAKTACGTSGWSRCDRGHRRDDRPYGLGQHVGRQSYGGEPIGNVVCPKDCEQQLVAYSLFPIHHSLP